MAGVGSPPIERGERGGAGEDGSWGQRLLHGVGVLEASLVAEVGIAPEVLPAGDVAELEGEELVVGAAHGEGERGGEDEGVVGDDVA